jgi:hypothetical protein
LVDIFHYPFPLYRLFFCPANRVWGHPYRLNAIVKACQGKPADPIEEAPKS